MNFWLWFTTHCLGRSIKLFVCRLKPLPFQFKALKVCFNTFTFREKSNLVLGEIVSDVLTPISDFAYVKLENEQPAKKELVFVASDIPPLGVKVFSVKKTEDVEGIQQNVADTLKFGNDVINPVPHFLLKVNELTIFCRWLVLKLMKPLICSNQ